jgi:hypothetical protein
MIMGSFWMATTQKDTLLDRDYIDKSVWFKIISTKNSIK